METGVLAKICTFLAALFPGALGVLLSLFIKKSEALTRIERVLTFIFGVSIAYLIGGAIIEYFKLIPTSFIAYTINFFVGFLGMASLAQLLISVPKIVETLRKKYIGD